MGDFTPFETGFVAAALAAVPLVAAAVIVAVGAAVVGIEDEALLSGLSALRQ